VLTQQVTSKLVETSWFNAEDGKSYPLGHLLVGPDGRQYIVDIKGKIHLLAPVANHALAEEPARKRANGELDNRFEIADLNGADTSNPKEIHNTIATKLGDLTSPLGNDDPAAKYLNKILHYMAITLQAMSLSPPSLDTVAVQLTSSATQVSKPNIPKTTGEAAGYQVTPFPTEPPEKRLCHGARI